MSKADISLQPFVISKMPKIRFSVRLLSMPKRLSGLDIRESMPVRFIISVMTEKSTMNPPTISMERQPFSTERESASPKGLPFEAGLKYDASVLGAVMPENTPVMTGAR